MIEDVLADGCGVTHVNVIIGGFSSNPGNSWLTSITCNGVTKLTPDGI